jgi:four helix bundle protein
MSAALRALELSDRLPPDEKYRSKSQVHGCAPSVCANIAEAWRKRRYKPHFISKLTDAEAEAAETQVWMELGWRRGHITKEEFDDIFDQYEKVLGQLVLLEESTKGWQGKLGLVLFTALMLTVAILL